MPQGKDQGVYCGLSVKCFPSLMPNYVPVYGLLHGSAKNGSIATGILPIPNTSSSSPPVGTKTTEILLPTLILPSHFQWVVNYRNQYVYLIESLAALQYCSVDIHSNSNKQTNGMEEKVVLEGSNIMENHLVPLLCVCCFIYHWVLPRVVKYFLKYIHPLNMELF